MLNLRLFWKVDNWNLPKEVNNIHTVKFEKIPVEGEQFVVFESADSRKLKVRLEDLVGWVEAKK